MLVWSPASAICFLHHRLFLVALITVWMITETCLRGALAQCPFAYWDKPSKRCAQPLISALQAAGEPTNEPATEPRNNRTCANWERTNACYQQLMRDCSADATAVTVLRTHLRRYLVYSRPCSDRSQRNQQLSDCFLVHFTPTQTCTEAFDKYFRSFVVDKQYSNACRVVISALKCFHDLTQKIESGHCGTDGAAEYRRSYILPVVDQSRDTVTTKCTIVSPYDKDYVPSAAGSSHLPLAPSGGWRRNFATASAAAVAATVVGFARRWLWTTRTAAL